MEEQEKIEKAVREERNNWIRNLDNLIKFANKYKWNQNYLNALLDFRKKMQIEPLEKLLK